MSFDPAPEFPSYSVVFTWKSVGFSACDKVIQVWVTMENARGRRLPSAAKHLSKEANGRIKGGPPPSLEWLKNFSDPRSLG